MTPPTLLDAQVAALAHDERIDTLSLDPIRRGIPSLPLEARITQARATLTIEGASTLEVHIHDPDWLVEKSGLLNVGSNGRMTANRVMVDRLAFRLVKASRQDPDLLELTFEDEAVALLRQHNKPLTASRGSMTRAQFIEKMVREVKTTRIEFYSPEKGRRQPTRRANFPDAEPSSRETGFDDGTTFKIKGETADASQMREVATSLTVADQEGAKGRARLAMIVAGIGESEFRAVMNRSGSPYGGVFQGNVRGGVFKLKDTAGMARYFLKGGKGFQAGGAIKAARDNPDWSPGRIALAVEGSVSNFASVSAGEHHYQQHAAEGRKILEAWGSGDGAETDEVVRTRSFQFTRGHDGKRETSWDAATRLAEDVRWLLYAFEGTVYFVSGDYLITKPAALVLDSVDAPGLLEKPAYDWDHGKTVGEVVLRASANRWSVRPGDVVALRDMGPVTGRWIVQTVEQDLLDATDTVVTLTKPLPALKEPAAETTTGPVEGDGGGADGSSLAGAARAVRWARQKIGDFSEPYGNNRGRELDALQAGFGLKGAPWCAIFVTTAVTRGGVTDDCKSAAVAQIYAWAMEGSHGYQKGLRATPRPGDLMLFNPPNPDDHIAIVEKVRGDSITTIEGNTSANKVARLTRKKSTGVFVRPNYPN